MENGWEIFAKTSHWDSLRTSVMGEFFKSNEFPAILVMACNLPAFLSTVIRRMNLLWMNSLWFGCLVVMTGPLIGSTSLAEAYNQYTVLLKKYVHPSGVDYRKWFQDQKDLESLQGVLDKMAAADLAPLTASEQKAFYINLYNAAMLAKIFQHYPVDSVTSIAPDFGVFKEKFIRQGDRLLSLDEVEKSILLKTFQDARAHFAVNCASWSCPPLRAEAYRAEVLDDQLNEQARLFADSIHGARMNRITKTVGVSSLFEWYASDFKTENPLVYLNQYRTKPLPVGWKIVYVKYDWRLNQSE